jgi:hypothetical protein
MSIALKLKFKGETRRVMATEAQFASFEEFSALVQTLFPILKSQPKVELIYTDVENERVLVSSQQEFVEALRVIACLSSTLLKFDVKEPLAQPQPTKKTSECCFGGRGLGGGADQQAQFNPFQQFHQF